MLDSIFESKNKIRNIPSLFNFLYSSIFNILFTFLKNQGYKKKLDTDFDEMLENEKLEKVIKETLDENSNPFLTKLMETSTIWHSFLVT